MKAYKKFKKYSLWTKVPMREKLKVAGMYSNSKYVLIESYFDKTRYQFELTQEETLDLIKNLISWIQPKRDENE